ncbi:retinol dehydrogenase 7-like [Pelodiscus sinensis]|uniref:retinol dehydrogenase 7-like n=1 Tax=Pelodiscus sinensis TaxID=13735 RepID=UPI003F6BF9CA
MWLYLAALLGLYFLRRWYREQQTVENLREKHVLITGCDSGFGNLLAKQLDARGLRVLAACLTPQGAEQLRQATSERLQTVILDVSRSDSIAAAAAWVKAQVGDKGLWGLVNNAGIMGKSAPNEWLTKDDFATVLNVNLLGPIEVTLSLLPLVKRARGRVVNVASVMGRLALFGGGYCLAKHGVEAFSDSLRRELLPFGVKISIIEPGAFQTPILNVQKVTDMIQEVWDRTPAEVKEAYGQSYFDTYRKEILQLFTTASPNLSLVTDCMEHALTARHPRTRYSGGWDAQFYYIPVSYLPTSWQDFLATRQQPKPAHGI